MPQQLPKFSGTGVALITPFKPDFSVDYPALGRVIDYVITGGVDYIVSLGTTGEAITLSGQECREVLDYTIAHVNRRVPIVAGFFGGNYTERLETSIRNYNFDGVDAIMSSSPAYSKPPQEGIYQHYMRVADASSVPVIIYNVPGRTSSNVLPETLLRLSEDSENFAAVKEASGKLEQAVEILKHCREDFAVLSGDDPLTPAMIALGAHGGISVIANALPSHFSRMVRAALNEDFVTARKLNFDLLDIHPLLYVEGNPVGIKAAVSMLGLCRNYLRVPLVPLTEPRRETLRKLLSLVPDFEL
ncbi:4-hydroxy-tetrahydrodipicolinate synthase [Neolewinella lacunae]|uniref:4-hydroxy-tetrahydrodipicolinate synthase n=1 Tax=Neolewinella lacunae TaxID=1517758 RepID=A0A923PI19_9BACT|nr:4-hydroxy-tetrahydrodipicolinate synthase [Neolewinella lacunae]MBC6994457.1 4-hydroxy-tetrahydrodipicolinate synthase [Neolewinella lacunae]MDN3634254.1 4-hydroxy-tetrahydrodipicolinate synthase [Neolewinella lacunae]